jgi:hypothetical protein
MRKLLVILGVLLLVTAVSAQDQVNDRPAMGFKIGLNLANVSGSGVDALSEEFESFAGLNASNEQLVGFALGGFVTYNLSPMVALQPEFLYSIKGFTMSVEGVDVDLKLNYFEVPVLFKFMFGTSATKPFVFAGPEMGILLSSSVGSGGLSIDAGDLWKSTDLGLVFGGGVDFPVGKNTMSLDGRYEVGLSKIPDAGDVDIDIKTTNISFMFGFAF